MCKGVGSGQGSGSTVPFGCFQTLGDLRLDFVKTSTFTNYLREQDLNRGLVNISYKQDGVNYHREIIASYPDRAIVIRLTADKNGALSFKASLTRPERFNGLNINNI